MSAIDHTWQECRPAVLGLASRYAISPEMALEVVMAEWEKLTDSQKEAFHEFCCLNKKEHLPVLASFFRNVERTIKVRTVLFSPRHSDN